MVGPSSSHTAGALRIALMAHELMGRPPQEMRFTLYGSFAHTYRGHGTDRALVAGLLGFRPDDLRIRDSFEIARAQGISFDFQVDSKTKPRHPNTVAVWVRDAAGEVLSVRGESIGGGAARLTRVDGIKVEITGEYSAAIIYQQDMPGVLGFVASTLGDAGINIGNSTILRERKGGLAYNVLEVDSAIPDEVQQVLLKDPRVLRIRFIPAFSLAEGAGAATPRYTPEEAQELFPKLDYQDGASIMAHAYTCSISLGRAFLDREELLLAMQGKDMSGTYAYLDRALQVMRESVKAALEHGMHTMGGIIGGEAHALMQLALAMENLIPRTSWIRHSAASFRKPQLMRRLPVQKAAARQRSVPPPPWQQARRRSFSEVLPSSVWLQPPSRSRICLASSAIRSQDLSKSPARSAMLRLLPMRSSRANLHLPASIRPPISTRRWMR